MPDWTSKPHTTFTTSISFTPPEIITLSNGIKLQVIADGEEETNKLAVYLPGGNYEEAAPLISALTAAALFEGNEHATAEKIAQDLDFCGAGKQVNSYDHFACATLSSLNYNFLHTCQIFFNCVCSPTFPESNMQNIVRRVAGHYKTSLEEVETLAENEINRQYYGERHPLSRIPTPQGIESISSTDLKQFHARYYHPENCRIILSGRITDKELRILDDTFGQWKPSEQVTDLLPDMMPESPHNVQSVIRKQNAVQSAIKIRIGAIPRVHPDYIPLRILITALGGYFGSRLMKNIREEKGFTYNISASLSGRRHDGYIDIETQCDTAFTWKVIDEIKAEISRLQNEPLDQDELLKVKKYIISSLTKVLDTPSSRASYTSTDFLYGTGADYFSRQVEILGRITPEELAEIARKYLDTDSMLQVVAGNV